MERFAGCNRTRHSSSYPQVSHLLAALQQGSRGTQACINASSAVQGIVSDLDTTVLFAASGTLNPETEGDTFGDHRFVHRNLGKVWDLGFKTVI